MVVAEETLPFTEAAGDPSSGKLTAPLPLGLLKQGFLPAAFAASPWALL